MTRQAFRAFAVGPLGERFLTVKQPFVYGGAKMRKRIVVTVSVLAVLLVLAGCASMHSMFRADTSKLKIGMTSEQVIDAIGHPTTINHSTDANGTQELWIYQPVQSEFSGKTVYVLLVDGKVAGWND
jgi:hypothetical protein